MDELFDFRGPSTPSSADPVQHLSRREARDAASRQSDATAVRRSDAVPPRPLPPRRAKAQAKAVRTRRELSRTSSERRAVEKAVRASTGTSRRKNPLSVLATMACVTGMFAVVALPAYAQVADQVSAEKADTPAQSMVVSTNAAAVTTARDGYRATTPQQLAEMTKDQLRADNNAAYLASGAREMGDDYPWFYELSDEQGGGLSPLNYYYRECVDFVAWRLNRDAGSFAPPYKWVWSSLTPSGGNASQWEYAWEAHGWTISKTPVVGSVAWFGWSNHVAYVKAVNADGTVLLEEYNYNYSHVYNQRTIPASSVEQFLYPPT